MGIRYLVLVWVLLGSVADGLAQETPPTPVPGLTPGAEEQRPDGTTLTLEAEANDGWFGLENYVIAAVHWVLEPFAAMLLGALDWIGWTEGIDISIDLTGGTIGYWMSAANCYLPLTELLIEIGIAFTVYSVLILMKYSQTIVGMLT